MENLIKTIPALFTQNRKKLIPEGERSMDESLRM